ncbi:MAG: exodeoxyribonuclease VII large subunit [Mycobacterium sp.]
MTSPGSSAENPFPVRAVAIRVASWIDRLGAVWVEGQLTEIRTRGATVYMVLRDPAADMSMSVTCSADLVRGAPVALTEGTQVVVCGKAQFNTRRGSFSLRLSAIRAVGLGELLARIERLRGLLAAEGLFDERLKRPLPFLPTVVGLITGRGGAAEHDVTSVATQRWPAVRFAIRNTAVQGSAAVAQIVEALLDLDGDPAVDVIVIARGGGSVEDLLPFSDETLCRAIAACRTPVVSAVGHEPDNPLCDLVADVRAATPTDAAKRVVPDAAAEARLVAELRRRAAGALRNWVIREERALTQLRSRPVLADPLRLVGDRAADTGRARADARRAIGQLVSAETDRITYLAKQLSTLGPAATLARGYAVVQRVDGTAAVLRSVADAPAGALLRVRLSDGAVGAVSSGRENGAP